MKKNIILLGALLISSIAYSQVGINNEAPKATLDVTAKTIDGTKPEGIIAPRLTGDQIKLGDTQYDTSQIGTIVYATAAVGGTPAGKTINITTPGYYYFDNNKVWVKFGSGTATPSTDDWHLTGNAGTNPTGTVPAAVGTSNYVGTSDAKDFVVGVNGYSRAIFTQSGSLIGGAGTMDPVGALPAHIFGATPTGSFIWGGGHRLAIATDETTTGNANYAAVYGNRNTVQSSNGFTTGTQNIIGTGSVASMVSGNLNNIGNYFQTSIVTGRSNIMNYAGPSSGNGNIIGGRGNNLSGTTSPEGAIVGGLSNTITAAGNGFLLTGTGNTISGTMPNAAVVGQYNTPVDNSLFTVGNGTAAASKSNAIVVFTNGSVAINASAIPTFTSNSATITPKLHVAGDVASTGAFYTSTGKYADYVFEDYYDGASKIDETYKFKSLAETAAYIKANKHLPGVTSIKDILKTENGYTVNLSELSIQQLEKIEELYLHTIEQQEEIAKQKTEINDLKSRMEKLEQLLLKTSNNK